MTARKYTTRREANYEGQMAVARLLAALSSSGITQREAQRRIGVGGTAISRWKAGANYPSAPYIIRAIHRYCDSIETGAEPEPPPDWVPEWAAEKK